MSDTPTPREPVTDDAAAFATARGTSTLDQPRSTPRLRRESPTPAPAREKRPVLVPAASSFDLLDGEYAKTRKSRLLSVVSVGFSGLIILLLLAQLLRVQIEIGTERDRIAAAVSSAQQSRANLDQLSQFGGIPAETVTESVVSRSLQASKITEQEIDLASVIREISASVPSTATLMYVTLKAPAASNAGEGADSDATPSTIVEMVAMVASYDDIAPLLDAFRLSPTLGRFTESWSGSVPSITVNVQFEVDLASSSRFIEFTADTGDANSDEEGSN